MDNKVYSVQEQLEMDPLDLMEHLKSMIAFEEVPNGLNSDNDKNVAIRIMNQSTSQGIYFAEMSTRASILKKQAKANKETDKYQHYLMIEDVFNTYADISKKRFDNVSRLITLKKTELEESRMLGFAT